MPQIAQAWRRGLVGRGHLAALIEAHQRYPRLSAELTLIETQLAEIAADLDPRTFQRTLMAKLHEIDPDAVDDAESKRRRRDIGLHVSTLLDGFVKVDGVLSPELGQHLINALASARDAIRVRDDHAEPPQPQLRLSQINADALQYLLDAATSATGEGKLPDIGGSRPVVQIVIDAKNHIQYRLKLHRRGDDDALGASIKVALQGFRCKEFAGAIKNHLHAHLSPRNLRGFGMRRKTYAMTLYADGIFALNSDLSTPAALYGIKLQQMRRGQNAAFDFIDMSNFKAIIRIRIV